MPKILEHGLAVVMLTAEGSEQLAVEAMKSGCHDYLVKRTLTRELLTRTVLNAIDRKSLQQQLETQRRELDSFVATAAHDLRGPLRQIEQFSLIAEQAMETGELEESADCLRVVQQSATRLSGMVQSLLEYARHEWANRRDEVVDLNDSITSLTATFRAVLDECGGRIESGTLPTVHGDPHLLTQLLHNLIDNALKFTSDEHPVVRIAARRDGDEWCVSVSDNGIGIAPQFHDEIFKPLRRLHTADDYTGHGFGLAICQRIMEEHGGRVWVESEPGHGSTFNFAITADR